MYSQGQRGFSLVELALVLVVMGLLLVPLTRMLQENSDGQKSANTTAALEATRDSLLAYAANHKGCLPHAADFEGGIPNTNAAGATGVNDTGSVRAAVEPAGGGAGQRAGDVPWADIGTANTSSGAALDGDLNRIQYYVAAAYTSPTQTRYSSNAPANDNPATRDDCPARSRQHIEVWDNTAGYTIGDVVSASGALYVATANAPAAGISPPAAGWAQFAGGSISAWSVTTAYVTGAYVNEGGLIYRALQNSTGAAPATSPASWLPVGVPGMRPIPTWQANGGYRRGEMVSSNGRTFRLIAAGPANIQPLAGTNGPTWRDVSTPDIISGVAKSLETRLGPQIDVAVDGQNNTASLNNVFVLIAPGTDPNSVQNRPALRDTSHRTCTGATNCAAWNSLNDTNVDNRTFSQTPDRLNNPNSPDTVLAVSFAEYQAYLQRHGLITEPVQY